MPERSLTGHLADERARAIRLLLASPLIDVEADPESFQLVARHRVWLAEWFDTACGWGLTVDTAAGFARLAKHRAHSDAGRPLKRTRGGEQPFDRRRYQLLCLACAELVRRPVTTIGLLAGAIAPEADLDTTRHGERSAFVDALRALVGWGALRVTAGEVDAFLETDQGNAILTAETTRLHRLLVSARAPSLLDDGTDTAAATSALQAEPRYGDAATDPATGDDQRLRWVRHRVARRVLDDPVVHLEDLSDTDTDYLANPAGRRWIRDRVADAGFELEERAEGLMAVDPEGIATDRLFPAPHGNAHQLALLLVDALIGTRGAGSDGGRGAGSDGGRGAGSDGGRGHDPTSAHGEHSTGARGTGSLTPAALRREVDAVLERFPGWARTHREAGGPERLADEAVELLHGFDLVRREPDGTIVARPALGRYRVLEPVTTGAAPTLFEEDTWDRT